MIRETISNLTPTQAAVVLAIEALIFGLIVWRGILTWKNRKNYHAFGHYRKRDVALDIAEMTWPILIILITAPFLISKMIGG